MTESQTPAGWYDDGSGRQRWWDGSTWTDHYAPETPTEEFAQTPASSTPALSGPKRTLLFVLVSVLVVTALVVTSVLIFRSVLPEPDLSSSQNEEQDEPVAEDADLPDADVVEVDSGDEYYLQLEYFDINGYTMHVEYGAVAISASTSVADSKPGEADVSASFSVPIEVTNTTEGRNARVIFAQMYPLYDDPLVCDQFKITGDLPGDPGPCYFAAQWPVSNNLAGDLEPDATVVGSFDGELTMTVSEDDADAVATSLRSPVGYVLLASLGGGNDPYGSTCTSGTLLRFLWSTVEVPGCSNVIEVTRK